MICFLTSAADIHGQDVLNPANGFIDELRRALPHPVKALFVCSDPDVHAITDFYADQFWGFMAAEGIMTTDCAVLDSRSEHDAAGLIAQAELIVLAGGHVPTQNAFFQRIGLRELMSGFDGVLISISAGTMNSADTVYAMPELPGEELDPGFCRTLRGLGLTDIMVIPHFQYIRIESLDGASIEEIALRDSMTRSLYAINDGTYIFISGGVQQLRGEAYLIENGVMRQICSDGQCIDL